MVAVADEGAVETCASFAARLEALVLQIAAVVLDVLVLAAAPQNPRPFGDDVEESRALAISIGAFVAGLGVLFEPVAAHAAALLADPEALLVAFLAAPHKHRLRSHKTETRVMQSTSHVQKKRAELL